MEVQKMEKETQVELDLGKLLKVCLRKWWAILLCMVVCGSAGFFVSQFAMTPLYTAGITVYVNAVRADQQISGISSSTLATSQKLVATYIRIVESDSILSKVAEQSGTDLTAGDLRQMLSAKQVEETELFQVKITHKDPEVAEYLANVVAEVAPGEIEKIIDGSSAKIVDYAKLPTAPSSPNVTRNTLLCAILGMVLSVAVIVIWQLTDVRIREEADLRALFDIPVLGQIPAFDQPDGRRNGALPSGKVRKDGEEA